MPTFVILRSLWWILIFQVIRFLRNNLFPAAHLQPSMLAWLACPGMVRVLPLTQSLTDWGLFSPSCHSWHLSSPVCGGPVRQYASQAVWRHQTGLTGWHTTHHTTTHHTPHHHTPHHTWTLVNDNIATTWSSLYAAQTSIDCSTRVRTGLESVCACSNLTSLQSISPSPQWAD